MADSKSTESDNFFEFDKSDREIKVNEIPDDVQSTKSNLENMFIITTNILKSSENKKEV